MRRTRLVRLFSVFVSLLIVIGMISISQGNVLAETTDPATGLEYSFYNGDTTATITGFSAPAGFNGALVIPNMLGGVLVGGIDAWTFHTGITSIDIPSSVTDIDTRAFYLCDSLLAINVDEANATYKSLDGILYSKNGTEIITCPRGKSGSINIPSSVTNIGEYAFSGCAGFSSITIPSSVTSIGNYAFENCVALTSITISNGVRSIGASAFKNCTGLTCINIPSSVTILDGSFDGCTALTAINVDGANTVFKSIDGILYTKDGTELISCPENKSGSVDIPSGVTHIEYAAFKGCSALTSITIPDGVTGIEPETFVGCAGLTSINIPSSVIDIGMAAFWHCTNLSDIFFYGNAPQLYDTPIGEWPFDYDPAPTMHNLSGTTGYTEYPWTDYTVIPFYLPRVSYRTHVQDVGWQDYVFNGAASGTSGQSKRLEAIDIKLEGITGGIEYRTHVQDIGWQDFVADGALSGTSGQSKRLEAIQIRLTGEAADLYDVYYRVHAQNVGWMGWAKNGASAGTAGYSYRLEAIEIKLVEKGGAAPGSTVNAFIERGATDPIPPTDGTVSYKTHVQDVGWQEYVSNGAESGTSGQSKRLEGIQIKLENVAGGIEYSTHIQDIGWQGFVADDVMSGTSGQSKRLEAIQIRLTGEAANNFDVYYCVHAQNVGWLDWAKNGESSGTAGFSYRLEAIKIVLAPKGGVAPGPTARAFVQA